ncbi:SDR family NAD(P)-dependent oxidoreductase [Clostridium sp. DL-VIII]|uniref:SDR family NAD(P)-dependent oxidoreductase n=1 Tax=Clostridium sp. DL-VIII TaxID=641107 RepID=UPI0003012D26|nr:SDR family NAD(P)-dependent oxidoreductase [Clostridium sp. DL-VIII]
MRTWFITGCSSGIGRGIAKTALNAGNQVVVTARDIEKLKELTDAYPDKAYAVSLDVSKLEDIKHLVKAAYDKFGIIDVLVNNAGYGYRSAIEESEVKFKCCFKLIALDQ